jgi:hypothetical protein
MDPRIRIRTKMSWIRNTAFSLGHHPDPRPSDAPDSSRQCRRRRLTALSQRRGRGDGGRMPRANMGLEIIGARSDVVAPLTGILDRLKAGWSRNLCKISENKFGQKAEREHLFLLLGNKYR